MNDELNQQFNKTLSMKNQTSNISSMKNSNNSMKNGGISNSCGDNLDVIHIKSSSSLNTYKKGGPPNMKHKSTQTTSPIPINNNYRQKNGTDKFHIGNPDAKTSNNDSTNTNNNNNNNVELLTTNNMNHNKQTESVHSSSVVRSCQEQQILNKSFNYVGQLQELAAKNQTKLLTPNYIVKRRDANGIFIMECQLATLNKKTDNKIYVTEGSASTKKEAKREAASKMLIILQKSDI